ncbi:MAG: hypothetical protein QNK23_13980 [Crocinitomicaceae bacterium]|nr:hypothetical protein [Crocinitomicaceae bacterium]
MVFFWRGIGIAVPIIFLITGWIVSYWYPNATLGNASFIGWTSLYSGIIITLLGLGSNSTEIDGETGRPLPKAKNDFMFIPVLIWGLFLLGLSVYMLAFSPSSNDDDDYNLDDEFEELFGDMDIDDDMQAEIDEQVALNMLDWRYVNIYNGTVDTLDFLFYSDNKGDAPHEGTMDGHEFLQLKVKVGNYCLEVETTDGEEIYNMNAMVNEDLFKEDRGNWLKDKFRGRDIYKRKVGAHTSELKDYDEAWLCLDTIHDFLLVDVKSACVYGMEDEDFEYIDWESKIIEWYDGRDLIEPLYEESPRGMKVIITGPFLAIPTDAKNNEKIYAIISYKKGEVVDQEFLQKRIARLYSFNFDD